METYFKKEQDENYPLFITADQEGEKNLNTERMNLSVNEKEESC